MIRFFRFSPSRLALSYIGLSVLVLALFAVPLWYGWHANIATFKAYVHADDLQRMLEAFDRGGADGLAAAVDSQVGKLPADEIMVFADAAKVRLAGNLPAWPREVPDAPGTYGLALDLGAGSSMRVVASHVMLPGGHHLLMGRESVRFQSLTDLFWYGIAAATSIVLILGAAVGWMSRRALLAEVHEISRTASAIVEGDLTRRLTTRGGSSELDTLARTVNGMLERLASQNVRLEAEIAERRGTEQALHRAHDDLEVLVAHRTAELARAIESLRRSEAFLAEGQRISQTGSWAWHLSSGKIVWSDEQYRLLGLEPGKAEPSVDLFLKAVHPDDRSAVQKKVEEAAREKRSYAIDYRVVLSDGAVRHMRSVGRTVAGEGGNAEDYIGVTTDITERLHAEEELRRQKAYLDELFDLAPDAIVLTDLSPRTIRVNKEFTRMFGYTAEEAIGVRLRTLVAPEGLQPANLTHDPTLLGGHKFEREVVRQRKDGTRFHAHITAARVRLQGGDDAAYVIYRDITERKCGEALLAGENRVLEMIAKGSPLGATLDALCRVMEEIFSGCLASIILIEPDGRLRHAAAPSLPESYIAKFDGVILGPSTGPCGLAAHRREAVIVPDIEAYPHSDDYRRIAGAYGLRACWSTPVFSSEGKVLGTFAVCFREPRSPNAQEQNTIQQLSNLASIVIERTGAVTALRRSEERFALAMRAAGEGHWDWNILTDEFYGSPRMLELYGFPPGTTFAGRADFLTRFPFHPEDKPKWEKAAAAHFAGDTARFDLEMRMLPRGELKWIHLTGVCSRDENGTPVRWTGAVSDITDRKRAEAALLESARRLRQAQRLEAMGALAGGIAHDFNNILGAILGYGEMALRDAPKGSRLRRDLDSIVTAGERGRALVDRILAFSRSGVGERIAVPVEEVVREALDLIAAKLPDGVTIDARLNAGRAALLGDPTQVHQVLMNLAMNGVQAMTAGGVLRVSLHATRYDAPRVAMIGSIGVGDYVVLQVADSGMGMAPDVLDRIFDPFFTTKEVGVGTGLGLSLVHGIVTELGGSIDVASSPGEGSVFTVFFPRHGDAGDAAEDQLSGIRRGNRQQVMVVDDEEPLVDLAVRILEDLDYVPVPFTSSAAALDAFRADPQGFDALITDERMPGLAGSTFIREVRAIRRSMPILLVTGYVGGMVVNRAYNSGATEVLKKPLSSRELAETLARVLEPE
jgi:PAS domain S-box-containing protein